MDARVWSQPADPSFDARMISGLAILSGMFPIWNKLL